MSLLRRICCIGIVLSFAVLEISGCSTSGSNNDQGTSFLALGYYVPKEGSEDEFLPISAANLILGPDRAQVVTSNGLAGDGDNFRIWIGLQNRLSSQFLRIVRVDCSYEVQGADPGLVIPSDSIPSSFVLGPTGEPDAQGVVPDPEGSGDNPILPQVLIHNVDIITPDVFSFLNVNRNRLPELPFHMTVSCSATGITQAGDVLQTNEVFFEINFFDTAECCAGVGSEGAGGFQGGTGSGGTTNSFSNASSEEEG